MERSIVWDSSPELHHSACLVRAFVKSTGLCEYSALSVSRAHDAHEKIVDDDEVPSGRPSLRP